MSLSFVENQSQKPEKQQSTTERTEAQRVKMDNYSGFVFSLRTL